MTVYISVAISYCYIFLNKNNIINDARESFLNLILVVFLMLIAYSLFFVFTYPFELFASHADTTYPTTIWYYKTLKLIILIMFLQSWIYILIIGLFNDVRIKNIVVVFLFLISIIFLFWSLETDGIGTYRNIQEKQKLIFIVESSVIAFFLLLNFIKRVNVRNNNNFKNII